jgi:hypothetical protein
MKKHEKFSASGSHRWLNCPASIFRSEGIETTSSAASEEGTIAHELMEFALNGNIKDVVTFFENDEKYTLEMRLHVQEFCEWVRTQLKPNFEMLVEEKVPCHFISPELGGTADLIIIEPFGDLHVIDFKYGKGKVDHVDNTQMIIYALGTAHKFKWDFENIKTTIYQPRVSGEVARSHTLTLEELKAWVPKISSAIQACEESKGEDVVEGAWCKYCPAARECPALTTKALAKAKLDFAAPILPEPKALKPEQLKSVLDKAAYVELWIKEVKAFAESELKKGKSIPGWGLVDKRAQRKWVDEEKILKHKFVNLLMQEVLLTPAQAEKHIKGMNLQKKLKSEIEEFFKLNVVSVSSGTKLGKTTNDYRDLSLETDNLED